VSSGTINDMKINPQDIKPAPLWRRLAAMAYDSILVLAIWMVVVFIVLSLFGVDNARTVDGETVTLDPLYRILVLASMVFSAWAFFGWFWTHSGQTLGMQAWRLKAQNADGSGITLKQSLIRFFTAIPAFVILGAGYFYLWFNPQRQTLHEKLSDSVTVMLPLMEKDKA